MHVNRLDRKGKEVKVEGPNKEEKSAPVAEDEEERKETPTIRTTIPIKAYVPSIFSQWLQKRIWTNSLPSSWRFSRYYT